MTDTAACQWYAERLPYTSAQLSDDERALITRHLESCASCRSEATLWQGISDALTERYDSLRPAQSLDDAWGALSARLAPRPPVAAAPSAALKVAPKVTQMVTPSGEMTRRPGLAARIATLVALTRIQMRLIRWEVWALPLLAPLAALALLFAPWSSHDRQSALASVSALVGAAAVALLYNRETDTARELTLTTNMRLSGILLLRLGLAAVYQAAMNVLAIGIFMGAGLRISTGWVVTSWLEPLSCLAAVSLLVASLAPAVLALGACVGLWALRALADAPTLRGLPVVEAYQAFWHSGPLLAIVTCAALIASVLLLEHRERLA